MFFHAKSESNNKRDLMSEEQLALRTFMTCLRTSSADVSVQTESSIMTEQQII